MCQCAPTDCIPKMVSYITRLRTLCKCYKYGQHSIFAMDETVCWFDMPSETNVAHKGARSIPLKTTGHEKQHLTIILTAKADETKLKLFIAFKGKGTRLVKGLHRISGVVVRFSKNGWMKDALTID